MSHKKLSPFIVKVSVLGYFPLYTLICIYYILILTSNTIDVINNIFNILKKYAILSIAPMYSI